MRLSNLHLRLVVVLVRRQNGYRHVAEGERAFGQGIDPALRGGVGGAVQEAGVEPEDGLLGGFLRTDEAKGHVKPARPGRELAGPEVAARRVLSAAQDVEVQVAHERSV